MMKKKVQAAIILLCFTSILGCSKVKVQEEIPKEEADNKIVIYTSMYEEVVNIIDQKMESIFPQYDIEFLCKGTGGIQSLVMDEIEDVVLGCDMLMVAEPAYSLELKEMKLLHSFQAKTEGDLILEYDKEGYWYPVRICNMILAYNPAFTKKEDIPNSFYGFANSKEVTGSISMPNPMSSGTAMASVSALHSKYGDNYFKKLGDQKVVVESSSDALKKLEAGEYKEIMVLEESVLKLREQESSKLEVIYPTDGTINIPSTIMIIDEAWSANKNVKACEEITNWFLSKEGQENIVNGWMHSVLNGYEKYPYDSVATSEIEKNTIPVNWDNCFRGKRELKTKFRTYIDMN